MALQNFQYDIIMREYSRRQSQVQHDLEERRKDVEADLETAIQKGRQYGLTDPEIRALFELIIED